MRNTLSFKLCLLLGLSILVGIVLFSLYTLHYQQTVLLENARKELIDLDGIILRNTRRSMQSNYPTGIEDIIKTAGEQKNILAVQIYSRYGAVRYGSDSASIERNIETDAPPCTVCHLRERTDIPSSPRDRIIEARHRGVKTLAIVSPIFGEPRCYEAPCHYHPREHALLGVLEIHRSVGDVEATVTANVVRTVIFGLILFSMTSAMALLFVIRFVHRPVRSLLGSAARLSRGEYGLEVAVPSRDELGQLTTAFNEMSQKIEERRRKLFKSREEFRTLFDEAPAFIVVVDRDLMIRKANRIHTDSYGDRVGRSCFETHFDTDKPCEDCPAIRTFADGMVHNAEQIRKLPQGKELTFLVLTAAIREETGRVESVMEICTDVTGIKELQKELVLLGETVAGISHTIKNILGGLEGGMYVFETGLHQDNKDRLHQGWGMVERNVKRISGLVRDILFMSKERKPEYVEMDPAGLCQEVVELMGDKAAEAGVRLEWRKPETSAAIRVDPKGLHTVLVNLLTNAIEACRRDAGSSCRQVTLRYWYDDDRSVLFEVADNGLGMAPEAQALVFRRFFSTKGSAGTGLGLLVTKKIVEEHAGQITFDSTPGEGTVFTVKFPPHSAE